MKRHIADESGVALVFALFAVLILTGLATLLVSDSFSQQQQARGEVDFEGGLHVAEGGAESTIARLEEAPDFNTGETWDGVAPERDWAIAQALAAPASRLVGTADGESVAIRSAGSDNSNFVYGVGFVPSRAAYVAGDKGAVARVVRMKLAFEPVFYGGDNAILTEASLDGPNSNNWALTGSHGRIHTNGQANFAGKEVSQGVTTSLGGACTWKPTALAATQPCATVPPVSVPKVSAVALYNTPDAVALRQADQWFDLCPSGVKTGKDGSGNPTTTPCTGVAAAGSFSYAGGATGSCGGTWGSTNTVRPAVYYAHCGNVDIGGGSDGNGSVIMSRVNGQGGGFDMGGNKKIIPFVSPTGLPWKIAVLADGDVKIHGNPSPFMPADNPQLIASGGTVTMAGTPSMKNMAILSSKAKINAGSLGINFQGGGNGGMEYNGGLNVALGGVANPSIIDWEEMK